MKRFSLSRLRHLALLTVILISSLPSLAASFTYDGIIYDIIDEKAKTCRTHAGHYDPYSGYNSYAGNNIKGNLVLPENPNGYKLIAIGSYGFYKCNELISVTIPNSVTSIGESAFYLCKGLTSITIPNSVTSIGKVAFYDCTGLKRADFTNLESLCNIKFTDSYANPLSYAHNLYIDGNEIKDVIIPNSVTTIGQHAFAGGSGLTSVTIPNSVTSIGERAFCLCEGLTSITIPNSVTSIGEAAFLGCSELTSITMSNTMTEISKSMCSRCISLTSVSIPNAVTSIGDEAFEYCSSLTSVTIPNSVTSIGDGAFYDCTGLKKAEFANIESLCNIEFENYNSNPLYYAHKLYIAGNEIKDIVIPTSVTTIGNNAFRGCTGLTSVTIPNSVTSIEDKAFSGCSGQISIPNSVSSMGNGVFSDSNATVILANISLTDELESKTWINFTGTIEYRDIRYYYSFNEKYYVLK